MRTVLASTTSTNTATTAATISGTIWSPSFVDERRGALDLRDLDLRTRLEGLVRHVRARRPLLAADPNAATGPVDALQHGRARALERRSPSPQRGRETQVGPRDRPQEPD